MQKYAKRDHKRAARMLGYSLTLGTVEGWEAASEIWRLRLTATERAALSWAALRSLDPDQATMVAETVLGGAGAPLPPLMDPMTDARWWVEHASSAEIESYLLAILKRVNPCVLDIRARKTLFWTLWVSFCSRDQRAFLARAKGKWEVFPGSGVEG
ncbi:hypothetical protein [Maritimibacter sp. 55A14]|uniref:hypothetical protein n=1 Tax=Maritimibacter sp. 55A14 TaxID=2174844 RepID=UPI0011B2836A|nr:hypothetical protein [Maritimibacter sp. 55A14]